MISRAIIPTRHLVKSLKNIKKEKEKVKVMKEISKIKEKKTFVYDKSKEDRNTFLL